MNTSRAESAQSPPGDGFTAQTRAANIDGRRLAPKASTRSGPIYRPAPVNTRSVQPRQKAAAKPAAGDPQPGDLLRITRDASVQFLTPIMFRVIKVLPWETYHGWVWIDGYQLNAAGDAVERRSIFVQRAGLLRIPAAPRT